MPEQTKIFCANCFECSHNTTIAINDVDTHGRCAKCGSDSVMTLDVVMKQLQRPAVVPQKRRPRDDWRGQNADMIVWLENAGHTRIAQQWDGWDFWLTFDTKWPSLTLELRNCDGTSQKILVNIDTTQVVHSS